MKYPATLLDNEAAPVSRKKRPRKPHTPKYRCHRKSGQAFVETIGDIP